MSIPHLLLAGWLAAGVIVWNVVFDLHVSRGVKEYLYRQARHEPGTGPAVRMEVIMAQTVRDGARAATLWGGAVAGAGTATVLILRGAGRTASRFRPRAPQQASPDQR